LNATGLLAFLPLLAFQVWDAFGWLGQVLFSLRVLHQWYFSEKAGRSHVTAAFWWYSLAGTAASLVYVVHRKDPVFIAGFLVNGFLYARNLQLSRGDRPEGGRGSPVLPVALGLVAFGAVSLLSLFGNDRIVSYDHPLPWLLVGFVGQGLWTSRFLIQWYVSERLGRSVLPPVFFWVSLAGAPFLFAWAVYRVDWVMMFAYALNPIPYVRNLILLHREKAAVGAAAEER